MKYVVIASAVVSFGLLFLGLYFDFQDNPLMHKMYGFGTLGIFIITFPLFLFWRRNKISMDKYVWQKPKDKSKEDEKKNISE